MLAGVTHFVSLMESCEIYHCDVTASRAGEPLSAVVRDEILAACRDNIFELKSAEDRISKKIAQLNINMRAYFKLDPEDTRSARLI
jgi:hypothetical protein